MRINKRQKLFNAFKVAPIHDYIPSAHYTGHLSYIAYYQRAGPQCATFPQYVQFWVWRSNIQFGLSTFNDYSTVHVDVRAYLLSSLHQITQVQRAPATQTPTKGSREKFISL